MVEKRGLCGTVLQVFYSIELKQNALLPKDIYQKGYTRKRFEYAIVIARFTDSTSLLQVV